MLSLSHDIKRMIYEYLSLGEIINMDMVCSRMRIPRDDAIWSLMHRKLVTEATPLQMSEKDTLARIYAERDLNRLMHVARVSLVNVVCSDAATQRWIREYFNVDADQPTHVYSSDGSHAILNFADDEALERYANATVVICRRSDDLRALLQRSKCVRPWNPVYILVWTASNKEGNDDDDDDDEEEEEDVDQKELIMEDYANIEALEYASGAQFDAVAVQFWWLLPAACLSSSCRVALERAGMCGVPRLLFDHCDADGDDRLDWQEMAEFHALLGEQFTADMMPGINQLLGTIGMHDEIEEQTVTFNSFRGLLPLVGSDLHRAITTLRLIHRVYLGSLFPLSHRDRDANQFLIDNARRSRLHRSIIVVSLRQAVVPAVAAELLMQCGIHQEPELFHEVVTLAEEADFSAQQAHRLVSLLDADHRVAPDDCGSLALILLEHQHVVHLVRDHLLARLSLLQSSRALTLAYVRLIEVSAATDVAAAGELINRQSVEAAVVHSSLMRVLPLIPFERLQIVPADRLAESLAALRLETDQLAALFQGDVALVRAALAHLRASYCSPPKIVQDVAVLQVLVGMAAAVQGAQRVALLDLLDVFSTRHACGKQADELIAAARALIGVESASKKRAGAAAGTGDWVSFGIALSLFAVSARHLITRYYQLRK